MKYCVYVFLDNKNRPYYVGKTSSMKRRRGEHIAEIKNGNPLPKYAMARKLLKAGVPFKMRSIRSTPIEEEAYRLERYFIKKYRESGYKLYNCTFGGPYEIPMRINKPIKEKTMGIKFPTNKKIKVTKKKNKLKKRR